MLQHVDFVKLDINLLGMHNIDQHVWFASGELAKEQTRHAAPDGKSVVYVCNKSINYIVRAIGINWLIMQEPKLLTNTNTNTNIFISGKNPYTIGTYIRTSK